MQDSSDDTDTGAAAKWTTLETTERRVLGVLIEKAKTTPENYPLTLAALTTGCNQKSNRDPQMNLEQDDVDISLDRLRALGVVVEVQGSGRVPKFRHTAYDWLGVNAREMAVMVELLLRGPQTAGELRSRAGRMESFADLGQMQETLESLFEKKLAQPLTPPGRGQQFAHNLYPPNQLAKLKSKVVGVVSSDNDQDAEPAWSSQSSGASGASNSSGASKSSGSSESAADNADQWDSLRQEVETLKTQVADLLARVSLLES